MSSLLFLIGKGCCGTCVNSLIKQFIELFDRLQAENEELKETIKVLRVGVEQAHLIRKDGKSPFNLLKAEIKAEAYKEFAERLKRITEHIYYEPCIVDNLLKELVGDNNA